MLEVLHGNACHHPHNSLLLHMHGCLYLPDGCEDSQDLGKAGATCSGLRSENWQGLVCGASSPERLGLLKGP